MRSHRRNTERKGPTIERMLGIILRNQYILMRAQGLELAMEVQNMFDVQRLVDQSKRLTDAVAANKLVIQGLVDAARAVADDPEQLEAVFAATEANINALAQAPVVGTPADPGTALPPVVEVPSDTGGSQAGIKTGE